MSRNSDVLILLLLLLLLDDLRRTEENGFLPAYGAAAAEFSGRPPGPFRMPEPVRLLGDFHRMTEVMGKVDHLGQMAMHPPKLPEPAELINTSALPDLNGMMEMLGPLLGKFGDANAE